MVSAMGYRLYRKRYTGVYHELLDLVKESREWSTQYREDYQSKKLHQMVKYCRAHIPYYQKVFADYGIHENDITHVSHIHKLPTLNKQTLREKQADFVAGLEKPYVLQHTSGSTGTPLTLQVNELTYKIAMALLVDHEEYHGIPFGAPRATFAGRMIQLTENMNPPFSRFNRAENQRLYSSYHLNSHTFPYYKKDLDQFQPWELIGYPSALCDLATHYEDAGLKPNFSPKAIVTNSETLLAWQRERIQKAFNCPVYDYYGTAEYVFFAGQDSTGRYQVNPVLGLAEIDSVDSKKPTTGSLIATTLTNKCMPLLRYEIGDDVTLPQSEVGKAVISSTLKTIQGRADDYIKTPDGRRVGRIDHIFKGITGIKEAQVIQDTMNHCIVKFIPQSGEDKIDEKKIKENLKARTSETMEISFRKVKEIERGPNGKFKSVISLIND